MFLRQRFRSLAEGRQLMGFEDISFRTLARAIDTCAWWIERSLGLGRSKTFETLVYLGPLDLLYPMLTFAASGYKVSSMLTFTSLQLIMLGVPELASKHCGSAIVLARQRRMPHRFCTGPRAPGCPPNPGLEADTVV